MVLFRPTYCDGPVYPVDVRAVPGPVERRSSVVEGALEVVAAYL